MFGEINGLPVHALVVHAAVIFTPIAALLGIGLWLTKWRMRLRWPLVAVVALAFATVSVAVSSGKVLRRALGSQLAGTDNPAGKLVEHHKVLAERLWWVLLAYLLVPSSSRCCFRAWTTISPHSPWHLSSRCWRSS